MAVWARVSWGRMKGTNCRSVLSESEKTPCHSKLSLITQNDREEIIDCMKVSRKNMYHDQLFTYYTAICSFAFSLFHLAVSVRMDELTD